MSLKTNVESLLFALGRSTAVDELARILRLRDHEKILEALRELKADYDAKQGPIVVVEHDGLWKMTVRDEMLPVVRQVVTKTELPKGVMETLATVAYKAPVLQSEIVKIRTNKAYDHLAVLEEHGFVTREKHGRSKLLRLGKKFFDYFDIPPEKLAGRFATVAELESAIADKEAKILAVEEKQEEAKLSAKEEEERHKAFIAEEHKKLDEAIAKLPEVDLIDEKGEKHKLDTYESAVYELEPEKKLADSIEVIKEPEVYKSEKSKQEIEEAKAEAPKRPKLLTPSEKAQMLEEQLAPEEVMQEAAAEVEAEEEK